MYVLPPALIPPLSLISFTACWPTQSAPMPQLAAAPDIGAEMPSLMMSSSARAAGPAHTLRANAMAHARSCFIPSSPSPEFVPGLLGLSFERQGAGRTRGCPARVSAGLGPAFGEGQRAGAERLALAIPGPGFARRLNAVARQARTERWDQQSADAVGTARIGVGLGVDQQGLADVEPGQ